VQTDSAKDARDAGQQVPKMHTESAEGAVIAAGLA